MDKATIIDLLVESLKFDVDVVASTDMIQEIRFWLAEVIADNIAKIRKTENKSLTVFLPKDNIRSMDMNAVAMAIKGFYVQGTKKPIYVSYIVKPLVNVIDVCISKHFRAWAIQNIEGPVQDKKVSKSDEFLRDISEQHPNMAKEILFKEFGCEIKKLEYRMSSLIDGTLLEHDFDFADVVIPKLADLSNVLLSTDTTDSSFDFKAQKKELKMLKGKYLSDKE